MSALTVDSGAGTLEEMIDAAGRDLRGCKLHLWRVPRCRFVSERRWGTGGGRGSGDQVQLGR